jgi:hypothetical protein
VSCAGGRIRLRLSLGQQRAGRLVWLGRRHKWCAVQQRNETLPLLSRPVPSVRLPGIFGSYPSHHGRQCDSKSKRRKQKFRWIFEVVGIDGHQGPHVVPAAMRARNVNKRPKRYPALADDSRPVASAESRATHPSCTKRGCLKLLSKW